MILMFACGIGYGALISNLNPTAHEICGGQSMSLVMGFALLFEGIGVTTGAPMTGEFYQKKLSTSSSESTNDIWLKNYLGVNNFQCANEPYFNPCICYFPHPETLSYVKIRLAVN